MTFKEIYLEQTILSLAGNNIMTITHISSTRSSNLNATGSLGKVQVFIITRIVELVKNGWNKLTVAEALGVPPEFVERVLILASRIR